MIKKDQLLQKMQQIEGDFNKEDFKKLLTQIFQGMRDVTNGFLKIAHGAEEIKKKKYYKELGYQTFDLFCKEVLNLTRKTVYLYLRIDSTISKYPQLLDEGLVTRLGSAKMDKIIIGINRIENSSLPKSDKQQKIASLVENTDAKMSVGEVEQLVENYTKKLR